LRRLPWIFLLFLLYAGRALGGELPVEIKADRLTGNVNTIVKATGRVTIKYDSVTITADNGLYDRQKGILRVWGNVLIREGEAQLRCQNLVYELKTKRAVLEKVEGFISPTDRIKADRIERLSEKEWIAYDGEYTPCPHKCPDWSVKAKKFKVLVGESFSGKWVSFRVKEIPILVTPYLSGPLESKRRSGLLFPRFGYISQDGFIYRQPLYLSYEK
jgi:LPS-assembly protein